MSADLVGRALAAYYRGGGTTQPADTSGTVEHNGKRYVVLRSTGGILAVYRVRSYDSVLKRLKRWPSTLDSEGVQ